MSCKALIGRYAELLGSNPRGAFTRLNYRVKSNKQYKGVNIVRKALVLALIVTAVLGMIIPAMADAPPPGQVKQPPPPGLIGHKDPSGFPPGNSQPPGQFPPGNKQLKVPS
jgi:hypothetical protein